MRYAALTVAYFCLALAGTAGAADTAQRNLLLVCSTDSPLQPLSHTDTRKVFLGVPVSQDGVRIRPLLNSTDPLATRVFLQQVVFMSEREYRRQLVSRLFRMGDQRPVEYDSIGLLAARLRDTPGSVSFMWSDQLEEHAGLKSLGVLWTSATD